MLALILSGQVVLKYQLSVLQNDINSALCKDFNAASDSKNRFVTKMPFNAAIDSDHDDEYGGEDACVSAAAG